MEEEIKTYTLTLPGGAVRLLEESLREFGGWLHDQEYTEAPISHDHGATLKKERCFKLQMAIRAQCPDAFKVQPIETDETDSEVKEPTDKDGK